MIKNILLKIIEIINETIIKFNICVSLQLMAQNHWIRIELDVKNVLTPLAT